MKILFLSAEVEPFAKVGGLADVAGSLPLALERLGHDVRVVMPAYGMVVNDPRWEARKTVERVPVHVNPGTTILADLYEIEHEGLHVWLIDGDGFFGGVTRSEEVYSPTRDAYLFFAQAALELCKSQGWKPDIVHANDWHMGFAPVFLREKTDWAATSSVYTLHNLAYQGQFGADTISAAGLDWSTFTMDKLETWGGVNFLKAGCAYADQVNTVSPTYASEVTTENFGCGLWGLMRHLTAQGRFRGVLNGIDTARHDPASDPRIPHHFSAADLSGKQGCKKELCLELGLAEDRPLMGVVSRLSEQKGFDLILAEFETIMSSGANLVILAIGDRNMATEFRHLQFTHPGRFSFVEAYDADLAQRVYAGIDAFLMPSSFEPCGLGQMFAMRYGGVPIVRQTGGLADTVREGENGFVFVDRSPQSLGEAIRRALECYGTPAWKDLVAAAMAGDYSWERSALAYEQMYQDALGRTSARAASL